MVKHKQFVGNLPTNCLSVFDHFLKLALKGLKAIMKYSTHPSNLNIKEKINNNVTYEETLNLINNTGISKSTHSGYYF